ncbi:hypothetical protein B0H14DRAFT_2745722 [Mycena olivaceomarginata]|nr:hypothetical protein B0H14DRAFT_2745722 [Mycena olivaceomarginata]
MRRTRLRIPNLPRVPMVLVPALLLRPPASLLAHIDPFLLTRHPSNHKYRITCLAHTHRLTPIWQTAVLCVPST